MSRAHATLVIPCEAEPPCACGRVKVSVYRDGIEPLIDNMGCELGLELLGGPFCPRCEAGRIEKARRAAAPIGPPRPPQRPA
ncbi:MAG: hypothetical protein HY721_29395 [Planctomycetes bacterium]|nr:hypothetical protein [Planctomycetota bacterium]